MKLSRSIQVSSALKRTYDLVLSVIGLLVISPFLLLIALLIKCFDRGPVFFQQRRVGLQGEPFLIWKFRTMIVNADKTGVKITKGGDARITPIGRVLRKWKLDELPQLINVAKGEMSLVGPRPEVPQYVASYTDEQKKVLELKPGITDLATLAFRNEEELLESADNLENFYLNFCVPKKIELNLRYAERANLWQDTKIIFQTLVPSRAQTF
jgi:lipopolysaccharide/colanic/teichoic acid biosynthesis glycosyltransferase